MSCESPLPRDAVDGVCALPEESLEGRLELIRRDILPHVSARQTLPDGMRFSFPNDAALRAKLERLVELERACCGGLDFEVGEADGLHLSVRGLDPQSGFFAALPAAAAEPRGRLARLARAGGLGFAVSFFVLCVVPMGLVALGASALAAPVADLESTVTLAAGTFVAGGAVWWLLRRRAAARARLSHPEPQR